MFPTFSFCLSLLFAFNFIQNTFTSSLGNKTDNLALLKFKESISNDPYGILASWNSSTHYWEIPTNLSSCSDLEVLFLSSNHLIGKIPTGINSLHKLRMLEISSNNLTGRIPPFIGNLSFLVVLYMTMNHLEGDIPQEMCSLKNLTTIAVSQNRIYGTFPSCLYNMSSLTVISAPGNEFNGPLPPNMFNTLPNLQKFLIGENQFSGTIPISIGNASVLQALDLSRNNLVGQVPSLGKLQNIQWINLELNSLARLVSVVDDTSHQETSTLGIKGTIGYAPPEYGMGSEISTYGNMYSFGVLLLEMLTGRRPTDEMFEDGQNLHMFVENLFPNNLIHILDPHLLPRNEEATIEDADIGSFTPIVEKSLVSLFRIGLACSMESPKDRMNIVDVTRELSMIKKAFLAGEID
ncbi:non-specific serine/threonine protein kinase [Trifolium repens]|nr:non-specific serine/threonine protein kinase [Trifolium repens]